MISRKAMNWPDRSNKVKTRESCAIKIGLVDKICLETHLQKCTEKAAREFGEKDPAAFASIKKLLGSQLADAIKAREKQSILDFVDIWYSEQTWKNLQGKQIHS